MTIPLWDSCTLIECNDYETCLKAERSESAYDTWLNGLRPFSRDLVLVHDKSIYYQIWRKPCEPITLRQLNWYSLNHPEDCDCEFCYELQV